MPTWPADWLQSARASARHLIPILYGPGPLLLLALTRWRQPEARLLLVLAFMPQRMGFYDQLPLLLVARNLRQQLILVLSSAFHDRVAPDWPLLELALDLASAKRGWQRRLGDPFYLWNRVGDCTDEG